MDYKRIDQQLETYIRECLVEYSDKKNQGYNIFDALMEKCRLFYDQPAHNLAEIKDKLNTKVKGDIFECLAKKYLLFSYKIPKYAGGGQLTNVWLLKEAPIEVLNKLGLKRNDLGIDLIGQDPKGRFYAVQAKYRKPNQYKDKNGLTWKQLSTFYALVSRTGPYWRHIVMTNADFCRHVGQRSIKDKSICYGTWRAVDAEDWMAMAGMIGHQLGQDNTVVDDSNQQIQEVNRSQLSLKELRLKRLARFE